MLKLEQIKKDAHIKGIDASGPVRIISAEMMGESAVIVVYRDNQGSLGERTLFRKDERELEQARGAGRP